MTTKKKSNKAQTDNNSTLKRGEVRVVDMYDDVLSLQQIPVTESFVERLAQDLVSWAKTDNALRITQFFNERNIPNNCLYRWEGKFPVLKRAHETALSLIADRRDIGAITKKYDGNYIDRSLAMYDPAYRSFMEWKSKLAKQEEAQGNVQVIIQKFPELEQDEGKECQAQRGTRLATASNIRSER